jgi:hypothetical protein
MSFDPLQTFPSLVGIAGITRNSLMNSFQQGMQRTHDFHLGPSSTNQSQSDSETKKFDAIEAIGSYRSRTIPRLLRKRDKRGAQAMFTPSTKITTFATGLFLSVAALGGTAQAQNVSNDLVARCHQIVGTMKFEGMPAERNQDTMTRVCQSSGGRIPGAPAETQLTQSGQFTGRNVALRQSGQLTTRNVALPQAHAVDSGEAAWMARASKNWDVGGN